MIPHQAQDVNLPIGLGTSLAQRLEEPIPIRVSSRKMRSRRSPRFRTWEIALSYSMRNGRGMAGSCQKPSACVNSED